MKIQVKVSFIAPMIDLFEVMLRSASGGAIVECKNNILNLNAFNFKPIYPFCLQYKTFKLIMQVIIQKLPAPVYTSGFQDLRRAVR